MYRVWRLGHALGGAWPSRRGRSDSLMPSPFAMVVALVFGAVARSVVAPSPSVRLWINRPSKVA